MLHTGNNNYRRAFWIALTTTVVFAIVASVLWWRLSHAGTASQPGATSANELMDAMAQNSSANASGSEQEQQATLRPAMCRRHRLPPSSSRRSECRASALFWEG